MQKNIQKINQTGQRLLQFWLIVLFSVFTLYGCGAGSGDSFSTTTTTTTITPTAPTDLTATPSNDRVSLSWTTTSGIKGYEIYRAIGNSGDYRNITNVALIGSFSDDIVDNGTTYHYKIKAKNSVGTSGFSSPATATPQAPPSKPTKLIATPGNSQVSLSWTAATGVVTGYEIHRATAGTNSYSKVADNITVTNYNDASAKNNTTYRYKLKAKNKASTGDFSSPATATPQAPPSKPTKLIATPGNSQVSLSWTAATGVVTGYEIHRATGINSYNRITNNITVTKYDDNATTNGITYHYKIKAKNSVNISVFSSPATATPQLSVPTNFTATKGDSKVTLKWTAVAKASNYTIVRRTGTGTGSSFDTTIKVGAITSHVDGNAQNGMSYGYKIKAINDGGSSDYSTEITVTVSLPAPILTVTAGDTAITLSWSKVTGATGYNIYHAEETFASLISGGAGLIRHEDLSGGTQLDNQTSPETITGLTNYVKYYFVVTASNGGGESGASNEAFAIPRIPKPLNDTGITWSWSNGQSGTTCSGTKQDCHQGRDAQAVAGTLSKIDSGGAASFDFTKLDSNGQPLAIQNVSWSNSGNESPDGTKWSCVKDNYTGLIWEVKTNDSGIHNKNNTYRWGGSTAIGRSHTPKVGDYYNDWDTLVSGSNNGAGLCGFTNWRVPTLEELQGIAHMGRHNPAIDTHYFPHVNYDTHANVNYWSSSPYADDGGSAWTVNFSKGIDKPKGRSSGNTSHVRLVRSNPN